MLDSHKKNSSRSLSASSSVLEIKLLDFIFTSESDEEFDEEFNEEFSKKFSKKLNKEKFNKEKFDKVFDRKFVIEKSNKKNLICQNQEL